MKFELIEIESIEEIEYEGKVYDLEIENDHSYNIENIIVHNSICSTRIRTGAGVPQFTALQECVNAELNIPIVADGGIKYSGDIVKALAVGANAVMTGSLFAGTDETPGRIIEVKDKKFKEYRGMASFEAQQAIGKTDIISEGVSAMVEYKGSVKNIMNELIGGLKSGISYCGSHNIKEMQRKAEFILMTSNGVKESFPHILL